MKIKIDLGRLARYLIVTVVSGILLYGAVFGTFAFTLMSVTLFVSLTHQTHDGSSIIFGMTWFFAAMAGRHHVIGWLARALGLDK